MLLIGLDLPQSQLQKRNQYLIICCMIKPIKKKKPRLSEKGLKRVRKKDEQLAKALRKNLKRRRERKILIDPKQN